MPEEEEVEETDGRIRRKAIFATNGVEQDNASSSEEDDEDDEEDDEEDKDFEEDEDFEEDDGEELMAETPKKKSKKSQQVETSHPIQPL